MLQNVPHQIIQSPARLGLPNPNSPSIQTTVPAKFSSQTVQSHQPNLHPNLQTTPTSLTLLPLLPPLSRAQSILIRMASLTTKLFEVSPNQTQWLSTFRGSFPTFLSTQNLSSNDSSATNSKEIISLFTTLQSQLFEAVTELQEILDLQDAKQKLTREIRSKDSSILAFANKLKEAERVLDMLVDDYSDFRREKRSKLDNSNEESSSSTTTVATQLKLSDILSYAHRISYTTFAPPEFGAGTAPLRGALPPAPQEEQMRASQLYTFADLDVGLPKETKEKFTIEPLAEETSNNPLGNMGIKDMVIPPNFVIPPGWKPGMPVQLPTDLPILPPAGWKPGDPVALPPFDLLPVANRNENQQPPPTHVPSSAKGQQQPIQVRHVELDIGDSSSSSEYITDDTSDDDN
ncbi:mediator of RNA polymerase II transcription subunit 4 [Rutidosis leptorrhynchoides]|uniref:mediator of RNA polymerase II transcription subunit 4 n=1 Tax=Rutidosis leptorrhynchoides TaxID=125765 RepID=UPI003A9A5C80